jgi:dihydroneopterin aldolase
MNETMTIRITEWRCKAFHGVYPEEKKAGGEFEVNLEVTYSIQHQISQLDDTISYAAVMDILAREMAKPRPLLETVAMETVEAIKQSYPAIVSCSVTIDKLRAPIPGLLGRVGVRYYKNFNVL